MSKDKEEQYELLGEVVSALPVGTLEKDYEHDEKVFNVALPHISDVPKEAISQLIEYIDRLIAECGSLYKDRSYKKMVPALNAMSFAGIK